MNEEIKNNAPENNKPLSGDLGEGRDVICAISTPAGVGGIAIVRLSGKGAVAVADSIFKSPTDKKLAEQKANTLHFGQIVENENVIDEVLVSVFHAPHSFTGEESVEISCHGSLFVQQKILQLLIEKGCRLATAGEFTQRAFLNGKMDLSQAEAVADLIASQSAASHRLAISQMRGGFSSELKFLREKLLDFVSLVELELDFSEEDVEFANRSKLFDLANEIEGKISRLANSFEFGNVLKNGIPVALVGETNVGKSTLLNLLLNEEKAIVSNIHGTTRDVIEDSINIQGITFRFIDTAGIRKTADTIENMGIERTFEQIEKASIVLWLVDSTSVSEHIEWLTEKILKRAERKKTILIFNKIDKLSGEDLEILNELFSPFDCEKIKISAKKRLNTELLQKALIDAAQMPQISANDVIITNVRHYETLQNAQTAISRVLDGLNKHLSGDFLAQDIRECMFYLGEITGQISTDEVLEHIFSKFCIGK
ncbi:MAG: tRNA uridine-5-carboxymethylaminomethyl(34) synthesis GTPase MnmE [Dysgonamonadaceae bacterium]|jgi:tRNA modification GTPase|nr:tRNA uridine-5-carboxymethylaminomethyl(34) synthesis GTPase MnmE [Dysgonamonadaceae bacterium]